MINVNREITGTDLLTLETAKLFMRVDGTTDDTLITSLISQARELIEVYLDRTINSSTVTVTASARQEMVLPYAPVSSITTVKDKETDEAIGYTWDGLTLVLNYGIYDTFEVVYDTIDDMLPDGLMLGWMEVVLWLYENRTDTAGIQNMLIYNANLQVFRNKIWI